MEETKIELNEDAEPEINESIYLDIKESVNNLLGNQNFDDNISSEFEPQDNENLLKDIEEEKSVEEECPEEEHEHNIEILSQNELNENGDEISIEKIAEENKKKYFIEAENEINSVAIKKKVEKHNIFDRDTLLNEYYRLKEQKNKLRSQNGLLNKKLLEYLNNRKMGHVLKGESIADLDLQYKYERKLVELNEYTIMTEKEQRSISSDLIDLTMKKNDIEKQLDKNFKQLQARELELSKGLIDTKTRRVLDNEVVGKLIQRQKNKAAEISEQRLEYIKCQNNIRQIEYELKALKMTGGTFHLIDYEQLRIENQNYADKIEERNEELNRLRNRCTEAVQKIAHIREKSYRIGTIIDALVMKCQQTEENVTLLREKINNLKSKRDYNRSETAKLKAESGLLTYPKLLKDMNQSIDEIEGLNTDLNKLMEHYRINRAKLFSTRQATEKLISSDVQVPSKKSIKPKVIKVRPSQYNIKVEVNENRVESKLSSIS